MALDLLALTPFVELGGASSPLPEVLRRTIHGESIAEAGGIRGSVVDLGGC